MGGSLTEPGRIHCPACRYPVFGLPPVCVCPECGVACDPHAKVYTIRHPAFHFLWVTNIWVFVLVIVFLTALRGNWRSEWALVAIGAALVLTLVQLYRFWRSIGRPHRVLINHRGVRFEHPFLDPQVIEWPRFSEACWNSITGRLSIIDRSGQPILNRGYRFAGGSKHTRQLAEDFNRLAERYAREMM